jgi:hypothetical protein
MKAKTAPHKEGEGITGATGPTPATGGANPTDETSATGVTGAAPAVRPDPRGALVLSFAAGAATLGAEDIAHLKEAVNDFVLQGGSMVQVRARGGAQAGGGVTHRPLASLSLGLSRATAIVNALIADGIGAERIKISAQGDQDVPAVAAEDWNKAGPDGAIVIFQPIAP